MTNTVGIFLQILKSQFLHLTCSLNMFMYLMFKEQIHRTNHYAATTWLLLRQNNTVNGPHVDSQCTLHHAWTDEKACVDHVMEWSGFLVSATDFTMDQRHKDKGWNLSWPTLNPLNAELNPICYLLALLGAHHFLRVSRIRVKSLTLRLLMSYIYIWSTHSWCF